MIGTVRLTDGVALDPPIQPLCQALAARGCRTIYSCGAHLDARPARPRAYVTFACRDARWMVRLRQHLSAPPSPLGLLPRELHFDCLLGRYTVALWAPADRRGRAPLDAALAALTAWVLERPAAWALSGPLCPLESEGPQDRPIPCCITLGPRPDRCGWTGVSLPPAS